MAWGQFLFFDGANFMKNIINLPPPDAIQSDVFLSLARMHVVSWQPMAVLLPRPACGARLMQRHAQPACAPEPARDFSSRSRRPSLPRPT
jgi:hypothetical protein